ncbi:PucR family transcriptional regulator [Pseudonocardia endophytica]|uniref:Sugar diacid utilization regulator n=1 Tax=Pseudonocardia endophytica TaxID=401976 RepID=A0A4R1I2X0_PSEEN|nr:helix-turn-helix domain-containing protein [Pseudonocardia endophytica]TCK26859.1 sugar diacid utilization regulator [Pseudonocardia endophytica]
MTGAAADGLQQVVDGLANRLGRSVAVDDTHGRVVSVSRHFGDEDPLRVYAVLQRDSDPRVMAHFREHGIYDWTSPGRVPRNPEIGFKARVCCPARAHGLLFGHLFLIDDGVVDREIELAAAAAAEVGSLMYRRVVLHEQEQARREELAGQLVADTAAERERAWRAAGAELRLPPDGPVVTVAVDALDARDGTGTALRTAVERATRDRVAARSLATVRGGRAVVLLFGDAATVESGRAVGTRVLAEFSRTAAPVRAVAGIGAAHHGPEAAVRGLSGARLAAHACALLPFLGDVLDDDGLGVYGLLLRLPASEIDESRLPAGLRRLAEQDTGGVLVDTLEAYLDCCGDATRTATQLRLHRSTLYYRLGRIETFTGVGLRDGPSRLSLHVGVKLRRVLQAYRERPELRVVT